MEIGKESLLVENEQSYGPFSVGLVVIGALAAVYLVLLRKEKKQ